MSDYTPTTQEVRHLYATAPTGGDPVLPMPEMQREFDRWLARHDQEVREEYAAELADGGASSRSTGKQSN